MELSMLSRFAVAALVLSSFVACGVSEEEFSTEYTAHSCDLMFECTAEENLQYLPYTDAEDCKTQLANAEEVDEAEDTCDFDKGLAAECLDAMAVLTCEDYTAVAFPPSCSNVCGDAA
jgi:hypothetical protein